MKKFGFCNAGFWFYYKGDEVMYILPWNRVKFNKRFLSVSFMIYFKSLKDIDEMWEDYNRALYHQAGVKVVGKF